MVKVILFGDKNDTSLTLPLCRCLERHGGVFYISDGCISEYSNTSPSFIVIESDSIENFNAEGSIFILKSPKSVKKILALNSENNYVVTEYSKALDTIREASNIPIIRCSSGNMGDVTLSSLNESSACVGIEHSITTLLGKKLEPCEFKVDLGSDICGYPLLAVCCVLILSEKNNGYALNI
ncbi:MAG TPA: hypothetical protein VFD52_04665 [Clostridia bacterium]|nr:hypothetical protein [Clostridia bacterium]